MIRTKWIGLSISHCRVIMCNCLFSNTLKMGKNSWKVQNPVIKILIRCGHFDIWGSWDLQVNWKNVTTLISESWILMGEWKTPPKYQLNHPYSVWHPLDTLKYTHTPPYQHRHTQCISKGTHKHPWHSTYIIWQPHFAQSPSDHPWPNKSLSDCLGSAWEWRRLFLGDKGNVNRVFDDILGSPGVSWGGQMD